tara:strand:+ start:1029 stop:1364 length:336 start_codon:yes stop_codon:yes gene_type:complete
MKTKKELKEAYKQLKIPMGVFQIKSRKNNKVLIDHSIDMVSKWNRHKMELKFGNHRNRGFQKDWNEYGEENFVFEVLSELKMSEDEGTNYTKELKMLQDMVIEELNIEIRY